uniref:Alpha/beta hydrolase n=1 Tax=Florenciella sp. virus SA2 TaxID=3240092 RepID=A0AB39JDF2_9VIRU
MVKILNIITWLGVGALFQVNMNTDAFSLKVMNTRRPLLFFPARVQRQLPGECYNQFITKMKDNYDVHVASDNIDKNLEMLNNLKEQYSNEDICLVAHSTGSSDLLTLFNSQLDTINSNKLVLIEPLDINLPELEFRMFNFDIKEFNDNIETAIETDYFKLMLDNIFGKKKVITNDGSNDGSILVIKHKQSDKWRFVPTIPPLSVLGDDLKSLEQNVNITEQVIDKYSHFDLMDRPWANMMNRAMMLDPRDSEDFSDYHKIIDEEITNFYLD